MPEYVINAYNSSDKPHTIVTEDKARAIRYHAGLAAQPDYHRVTVTTRGKVYEGDQIRGEMP